MIFSALAFSPSLYIYLTKVQYTAVQSRAFHEIFQIEQISLTSVVILCETIRQATFGIEKCERLFRRFKWNFIIQVVWRDKKKRMKSWSYLSLTVNSDINLTIWILLSGRTIFFRRNLRNEICRSLWTAQRNA